MGIIKELPKDLIEKIAAGEVVERPASVVKELMENAIDAGAKSIVVDLIDGGKGRIAVMDDGSGMEMADLTLCVRRHATSKIGAASDLFNINTMGFRGEALAAIGAVSRLLIETRPNRPGVIEGAKIEVTGGAVAGPQIAGCPGGTKVVVSEIFFNVPARQKFLKSANIEYGHVAEAVSGLALAYPSIRMDLSEEGRRRQCFAAVSDEGDRKSLEGRIISILGERYDGRLIYVAESGGDLSIRGWVSPEGRPGGKDVHIFLNRRPVRDKVIMHAVSSAFVGAEGSPAAVLWIDIDPAKVDVNVHPTKREVRFMNGGAVHGFVAAAVRKATTRVHFRIPSPPVGEGKGEGGIIYNSHPPLSPLPLREGKMDFEMKSGWSETTGIQYEMSAMSETRLRPIGQLGLTYVLCEDADGSLVLIDQHAAHERLGFEHLRSTYKAGGVRRQRLLIPERLEMGASAAAYIAENAGALELSGFEIEPFGGASIVVKAVPELLRDANLKALFEKLAHELEAIGRSRSVEDVVERMFSVIACHSRVRAGDKLSYGEQVELLKDMEKNGIDRCPHGRPATIRINLSEIEKWFKRSS